MYKVVFLGRFRSDLDPEEYRRWWRTEHAAIALRCPLLRRYVHSYWDPADREQVGFDGYVELWFDSVEDFEATAAGAEWQELAEHSKDVWDVVPGGPVTEYVLRWDARLDDRVLTAASTSSAAAPGRD